MSPSGAEIIRRIRSQIDELDPSEVKALNGSAVLLDVRESEEWDAGHIAGATHVPRGYLESRVEGVVGSDRSQKVVIYCASGQRSALAANTLKELLGYENVFSMNGGITLWKDRGYDVEVPLSLTKEQRERYSRHLLVPEIGLEGQEKLLNAKVLLLGAGGLGSPTALYLAAAGVGTMGLMDGDVVDLSNLQRQILHSTPNVGRPKVESGTEMIRALNPDVNVIPLPTRITVDNVMDIIKDYDLVIDGSDNFDTRYLMNDACYLAGKTNVHGSIFQFEGMATVLAPNQGPCYRCLYPTPPPPGLVPS
jgi:molybdopterin/thiamine biosynthesis adenylyltransferase/rhodanese-related sulfurtransferase